MDFRRFRRVLLVAGLPLVALVALVVPGVALANEVSISGSMEGSIQISQGDFVAGGYIFNFQGAHPAATVAVANASVVFVGKCSNGSSDNTLTIPLSPGPYQVAANDNSSIPTGDESSPASFQGSVTAHPCGGSGTLDASKGATFSGDLQSDVTANQIQIKFHYRDPAAKGKGNFDCSSPSSGSLGADVCGASWSGTISTQPDQLPVTPTITTTASAGGPVGTAVHDTAHLTGGNSPTGTITFKLYGAGDTTCAGAPINGSPSPTVAVNGNGDYTGPDFTPTTVGSYNWRAFYSGDANNNPVATACGDNNETVTITQVTPAITTTAGPGGTIGTAVHDVAHLTGTTATAGGSITFTLYAASDTTCTKALFTGSTPVNGPKDYTGPDFAPTAAGTYQWVASYSGDTNNKAVASSCNDQAEAVIITPAGPAISTNASTGGPLGTAVHDVAHLTGVTGSAGGSITFVLYRGSDTTCTTPLFTSAPVAVSGPNSYTGPDFTPTSAGTYQWVASYSGDTNNAAVASSCNDSNESVSITPPPAPPLTPGIAVIKYQRIDGTTGPYTRDLLTVQVGQRIDYEMVVSNTGQVPLAITFSDPHCDAGSITGPTGDLNSDGTLKPGGQATWFCFHIALASDRPTFTNTVTVTGTPPSGPPVGPVSSSVTAQIPAQGVAPSCVAGPVALQGTVGCARRAFQAVVQAAPNTIKSVTFLLDGKKIRTLTHPGKGNQWALTIHPNQLRVGGHTLTAQVTLICNNTKRTATLHFRHCPPPKPRFTG